ncbi:MAG: phosphate acyltransferase, partial [bacterium]
MTSFPNEMIEKASQAGGTIVLPEGDDDRIVRAAKQLVEDGIVEKVFVLGSSAHFEQSNIEIVNPEEDRDVDELAHSLANSSDDMTLSEAEKTVVQPLFYGAAMVEKGEADGMVAGAANPTANVLRAALNMIGTKPESSVVSSSFVMEVDDTSFGQEGRLLFTDPA